MSDFPLSGLNGPKFEALLRGLPLGAIVLDDGRIKWANRAFGRLVSIDPEVLLEQSIESLPFAHSPGELQEGEQLEIGGRVLWCWDSGVRNDGQALWLFSEAPRLESTVTPMHARATTIDRESGSLARAAISQALHQEVARSRRYGNPLCVACVQCSHINEPGAVGTIGRLLRERTRWADAVGRWGPGRFLLVLPETTFDAATKVVADILANAGGEQPSIRIATGVAEWRKGDDESLLLDRANMALEKDLKFDSDSTDG
ncbi:MAG: hypothetical protein K0U93_05480 [Gammaproteobacteria bacterium]|nr:hypothetical protein [Gammaproteobacteria bacterium]